MKKLRLYQIVLPYAVFGIIVDENDIIFEAPPIARWMMGKELKNIELWVATKHGSINNLII